MRVKDQIPSHPLTNQNISPIIKVYFEFNHLKQLFRQGWLKRGVVSEYCESVAEHSFGVALLAWFLADQYFPELDRDKLLRMSLIHDFGEIYAGDITPVDPVSEDEKYNMEYCSIYKVLDKLPNGKEYISIWEEFESQDSPESVFIKQIDKLEMGLQASVYEHQNRANLKEFIDSAHRSMKDEKLLKIVNELEELRKCHNNTY